MRKRKLGWILLVAGAVGIILCIATIFINGTQSDTDKESVGVYGGLGLVMFVTGIEFIRRSAKHANT